MCVFDADNTCASSILPPPRLSSQEHTTGKILEGAFSREQIPWACVLPETGVTSGASVEPPDTGSRDGPQAFKPGAGAGGKSPPSGQDGEPSQEGL